jgi:hypothetical protein
MGTFWHRYPKIVGYPFLLVPSHRGTLPYSYLLAEVPILAEHLKWLGRIKSGFDVTISAVRDVVS